MFRNAVGRSVQASIWLDVRVRVRSFESPSSEAPRIEPHDGDLGSCPRLIFRMEVKGADHEIPRGCALRLGPPRARRKRENSRRPKQHYFRLAVFFAAFLLLGFLLASKALSGLRDRTAAPAFHNSEFLISDSSLSNLAL